MQKQWGRIVLGIDVAYTWADLERTAPAPLLTNSTLTASANDILLVTGKVGYAFDNLLASVRAGWASATVEYATNLNGTVASSSSEREGGWTAAVGIEYAVLPNVILGVEYDYIRINAGGTGTAPILRDDLGRGRRYPDRPGAAELQVRPAERAHSGHQQVAGTGGARAQLCQEEE